MTVLCALLLALALVRLQVLAVPLEPAQHAALMAVYENSEPPIGSAETLFPRFGVDEGCRSGYEGGDTRYPLLSCENGNVTNM